MKTENISISYLGKSDSCPIGVHLLNVIMAFEEHPDMKITRLHLNGRNYRQNGTCKSHYWETNKPFTAISFDGLFIVPESYLNIQCSVLPDVPELTLNASL